MTGKTALRAMVEQLNRKTRRRYVLDKDLTGYRLFEEERNGYWEVSPRLKAPAMKSYLEGMLTLAYSPKRRA